MCRASYSKEAIDNLITAVRQVLDYTDEDSLQKLGLAYDDLEYLSQPTPIDPDTLEAIGCKYIHFNPNWNGGYREYFLPVVGKGWGYNDYRLVWTPAHTMYDNAYVWYVVPGHRVAVEHCQSIEDFQMLYHLLTGKSVEDAWNNQEGASA